MKPVESKLGLVKSASKLKNPYSNLNQNMIKDNEKEVSNISKDAKNNNVVINFYGNNNFNDDNMK